MLNKLKAVVGEADVLTSAEQIAGYATDWTGRFSSSPIAVVRPHTAEQVVDILRIASEFEVAVVPQGGNTGLVAGAVGGDFPHIIVSTRKLRERLSLDPTTLQLTVSAGYTIGEIQAFAQSHGLEYRVDLASRDSATIGGTIATNAGGIRVLAHGMTRAHVRGIEMILSDGHVLDHLEDLIKDNTGPDVSSLAIGSEGTLGIITAARVQLYPQRCAEWTMLVPCESIDEAIHLCTPMQPQLLAAELILTRSANEVADLHQLPRLNAATQWWLLIEGDGEPPGFEELPAASMIAQQHSDTARFWKYREHLTEVIARREHVVKVDVSVAVDTLAEFIDSTWTIAMSSGCRVEDVYIFGHVMDGNLHISIAECATRPSIAEAIIRLAANFSGAISAEHGVGQLKNAYLSLVRTGRELDLFWQIRAAFDPKRLMNPHVLCDGGRPAPDSEQ